MMQLVSVCYVSALVAITIALSGCGNKEPAKISSPEGRWLNVMSCNADSTYSIQYGWVFSRTQDPSAFGTRAKDLIQKGFKWLKITGVAGDVAGAAVEQLIKLMGDDWNSQKASQSQTFAVRAATGGFIWQWQFAVSGTDDFTAALNSRQFMVTSDSEEPLCLPGQFQDMNKPYGTCKSASACPEVEGSYLETPGNAQVRVIQNSYCSIVAQITGNPKPYDDHALWGNITHSSSWHWKDSLWRQGYANIADGGDIHFSNGIVWVRQAYSATTEAGSVCKNAEGSYFQTPYDSQVRAIQNSYCSIVALITGYPTPSDSHPLWGDIMEGISLIWKDAGGLTGSADIADSGDIDFSNGVSWKKQDAKTIEQIVQV